MRLLLPLLVGCAFAACGEPPSIVVEPLQVISFVPNRGARCVAARATDFEAYVTFSDDIVTKTLSDDALFVRPAGGAPLAVQLSYDKVAQTATARLLGDLDYESVYELVVTESIRGAERGRLVQELVSPFTTISAAGCF